MLCALSVAFLWLSGILPLSTYFWPILASAALLPAREECRKSYAWSCFAAAAILGLLLCADKEAALLFCFLGYYPLLKPKIDAISSKVLRLLLKVALYTVSMGLMYALIIFVFKLPAVVQEFSETAAWLLWVTAATMQHAVNCGCFAAAIRAQKAENFAFADFEIKVIKRENVTITLYEAAYRNHRIRALVFFHCMAFLFRGASPTCSEIWGRPSLPPS